MKRIEQIMALLVPTEQQFDVDIIGYFIEPYKQHEPNRVCFIGEIHLPSSGRQERVLKCYHTSKEGAMEHIKLFADEGNTTIYETPIYETTEA